MSVEQQEKIMQHAVYLARRSEIARIEIRWFTVGAGVFTDPRLWETKLNYPKLLRQTGRTGPAKELERAVVNSKRYEERYRRAKGSY